VITYFTPERFAAKRQIGIRITQEWHSLARCLTWPSFADDKRAEGAWCPVALDGGVVKDGRGPSSLLAADVDDCIVGALDRESHALRPYAGVIVPTFNATPEKPKNRIVLLLSRVLWPDEFPLAWTQMQTTLAAAGITLDRGCKNINRLYFACVAPSPERWMGARLLTGDPVDVDAMLVAAREDARAAEEARARKPPPRPVRDEHRGRYIAAAIDRARGNIAAAGEGSRHDALLRETFSLARLALSEHEIAGALLEPFVSAAGEARRHEGERAIRDAFAARKRSA
jgi:hypothetical protein